MFIVKKRNKKIKIKDINKSFLINNGKNKIKIKITSLMLNHCFGEFVKTKKINKKKK